MIQPTGHRQWVCAFVLCGGDTWTESLITVDGDMATWAPQGGGTGSGSTAGWFGLTGSGTDNSGVYYLDKSEFYDGPRDYTFTVEITNTLGDQTVFSSEYCWNIDLFKAERDGNNSATLLVMDISKTGHFL